MDGGWRVVGVAVALVSRRLALVVAWHLLCYFGEGTRLGESRVRARPGWVIHVQEHIATATPGAVISRLVLYS